MIGAIAGDIIGSFYERYTGGDMFCGLCQAVFRRISVSYFGLLKRSMFIRTGARLFIILFIGDSPFIGD